MERRKRLQRVVKDSTCTLEGLTVLAERQSFIRDYNNMSDKDIKFNVSRLDKSIAHKRALLGIVTEQPTMEYFWSFMGQEQVVDECRAKDLIIKGITVYARDNSGNKHNVLFDGLKLITNKEE